MWLAPRLPRTPFISDNYFWTWASNRRSRPSCTRTTKAASPSHTIPSVEIAQGTLTSAIGPGTFADELLMEQLGSCPVRRVTWWQTSS
eukprot:1371117-Rhodomonas_salina.1